jgi:hypothetical protein
LGVRFAPIAGRTVIEPPPAAGGRCSGLTSPAHRCPPPGSVPDGAHPGRRDGLRSGAGTCPSFLLTGRCWARGRQPAPRRWSLPRLSARRRARMHVHANAKLGPAGRLALTEAISAGMSQKAAAAAFGVSPPTAPPLVASPEERLGGGAALGRLAARSPEPPAPEPRAAGRANRGVQLRVPASKRLGTAAARRRPRTAALDGLEGARRPGLSRTPRAAKEAANRYEWPCPGELLHLDTARYARFKRPGHAVTGDRS